MSRDNSSVRSSSRSTPVSRQLEENENESDNLGHQTPHPPSRTPFNSIHDPSQLHCPMQDLPQAVYNQQSVLSKGNGTTPRVSIRGGKPHSEPNSAQSTPAKGIPRVSNVGGRGGVSSKASRVISIARNESVIEVPHFELVENPSFWKDHNVQVLIRIRPLNNVEKVSQEYGRCLRQESAQTLVWLGHPETRFTFDHVACETLSQEKLFKVAGLPIVENCMSGYNSCIFAYGQTGSGKTYTMMGEIDRTEEKLHEDCGITPRIFEYLFKRIREEEDKRRNERLNYSCKCSFLEIYNEQITDLLEPSSTNLQLREDSKKGVYVENLTEYSVRTVDDVIRLLLQGAANRKMAATHMNSESSRSHSVFTCIIESHWEKDSMTHLRFGRLNLVDLAGSERQKSSGAEGDRLKEAANINKSLSTLGHVIMSLVDLAHGKHRHVPYRDSRLTFLLQDSLGGNSKTTIIANVSPSICSANETMSTLKFAQRAKLIQNNAKINEDASGDVTALQQQIQQLKDQLSVLLKHHKSSEECSHFAPNFEASSLDGFPGRSDSSEKMNVIINLNTPSLRGRKLVCSKATLLGALRREKQSEFEVKRLKAEIEQMNILVHHQEEDAQHTKMMLSLRDEKIKCLELLADGLISADNYLLDENSALTEEIELLESRIQKNPELVQLALEKNRIRDQLRLIQDFYEQGERETLLAEISDLRDQLLEVEESSGHTYVSTSEESQDNSIAKVLEEPGDVNPIREDEQFQKELKNWNQPTCGSVMLHRNDPCAEMMPFSQPENGVIQCEDGQKMENELVLQFNDFQKELIHSRSLLEAMESEQICLIEELEFMRNENHKLREILKNQEIGEAKYIPEFGSCDLQYSSAEENDLTLLTKDQESTSKMPLQAKLNKLSRDLNEGQFISFPHLEDHVSQMSRDHQIELVQKEVEMETTKTILQLQEEVTLLQSELQERLHSMAEENASLRNTVAAKDDEIRQLSTEWERATLELTTFLTDGSKSLKDAASQVESITCLFPRVNVWISEHVEKAAKMFIEKEENILLLKRSLEDAQKTVSEMDQKLNSLKGVTIALTEFQQLEEDARRMEKLQSSTFRIDELIMAKHLGNKIMYKEEPKRSADKSVPSNSFELKSSDQEAAVNDDQMDAKLTNLNASVLTDMDIEMELARFGLLEVDNLIKASCLNAENHFSFLQSAICEAFSLHKKLILDLVNDIHDIRRSFAQLKTNYGNVQINTARSPLICSYGCVKHENRKEILHQVRDELVRISDSLNCLNASFCGVVDTCESLATAESLEEADGWSTVSSTSSSKSSAVSVASGSRSNINSSTGYHNSNKKKTEQLFEQGFEEGLIFSSDYQESEESQRLVKSSSPDESTVFCLQKELRAACDAFSKIYALLAADFCSKDTLDGSARSLSVPHSLVFLTNNEQLLIKDGHEPVITPEKGKMVQDDEEMVQEDEFVKQFNAIDKIAQADRFFAKFEKTHATMTEADHMLNALMKANENAIQLTSMWKQTGEELMLEKENLVEEIEQLKSSINLKDRENELWQEQIHFELTEIANLALLLNGSLQQDMEDICMRVYSDATVLVKDTLNSICGFRSCLEDIFSKLMENEILSFVLHHWHLGELDCGSRNLNMHASFHLAHEEAFTAENNLGKTQKNFGKESMLDLTKSRMVRYQPEIIRRSEAEDCDLVHDDLIIENVELKRELQRKEVILKGLFFDFSLLQESASCRKDAKDEIERLTTTLNQVEQERKLKMSQFDDLVIQHRTLEGRLTKAESALSVSNFDLEQLRGTLDILSEQNADFRMLLKDLYLQKSEAEQRLEEQRETMKDLENEILRMASSVEKNVASSVKDNNVDLQRMTMERDELIDQLHSLQDRLDIANALADEKEAIALEARQESEASKVYAEQKEEEVKILEHSVEELEYTINVLEKKVYEMEEEVERHHTARDALEVELQALRERLLMVESITDDLDYKNSSREPSANQFLRKLHGGYGELQEFYDQIRVLEEEKARLAEEVKQYRDYISELVVHAEAQSSQYQQKYKNLEAMVQEVRTDSSNGISWATTSDKSEKSSMRVRGSSSPFRCISNLVQQMNLEKDQELSIAKLRIEELEALLASRQKEVCLVNTRLAAVESMTHDVIRDLLGVKLDMTNYADLISQNQLQKFIKEAQQQTHKCTVMEKEVSTLRCQITDLMEERERCILEVKRKEAEILTAHVTLEQLRERDQLLAAQNEMLKADKSNLHRRVAELDDMVKKLLGKENTGPQNRQQMNNSLSRPKDNSHGKRPNHSEKPLPRWNSVRTDGLQDNHKDYRIAGRK